MPICNIKDNKKKEMIKLSTFPYVNIQAKVY